MQRVIPEAAPPTGDETFFGIQLGKWRRFKMSMLKGKDGIDGRDGLSGTNGADGKPKRVEEYTAVTNASGIATFTFNPSFTSVPNVGIVSTWIGEQYVGGGILTKTTTGATAQVMVSRGTLLLTSGPFGKAGAGVNVTIRVIGN